MRRRRPNPDLLLPVRTLLFLKRPVFQRARAHWQRASVSSLQTALVMQELQVLPDSDLRCPQAFRQVSHEHAPIRLQHLQNRPAPLFPQHVVFLPLARPWGFSVTD